MSQRGAIIVFELENDIVRVVLQEDQLCSKRTVQGIDWEQRGHLGKDCYCPDEKE